MIGDEPWEWCGRWRREGEQSGWRKTKNIRVKKKKKKLLTWEQGGWNPRPRCKSHGNSEVKPPKAKVVTQMGDLLSTWFLVHPIIYNPPKNPQWGDLCELDIFNQHMWDPRTLPLGEIGISRLVHTLSRCSPLKEGGSHQRSSNSRYACFAITFGQKPTWNETTP